MKKLILFSAALCLMLGGFNISQSSAETEKPPCPIGEFCFCFPGNPEAKHLVDNGEKPPKVVSVTECTHNPQTLFGYLQDVEDGLIMCGECRSGCDDHKFLDMDIEEFGSCKKHLTDPWYGAEANYDYDWEGWYENPQPIPSCTPEKLTFCVLGRQPHEADYLNYDPWNVLDPFTLSTTDPKLIKLAALGVCVGRVTTGPCPGDDGGSSTGGDSSGDTSGDTGGTTGGDTGDSSGSTSGGDTGGGQNIPVVPSNDVSGGGCSLGLQSGTQAVSLALLLLAPLGAFWLFRKKGLTQ